jgi:quinol monooxygenase YgiN
MIFVAGTMTLDAGDIPGFQRDVRAMIDKVRAEAGCGHYSLLVEDADAGIVNVLEQWTDDAALIAHLQQPWILEFLGRHGPHLRASTVRVFDIAGSRPLPGVS